MAFNVLDTVVPLSTFPHLGATLIQGDIAQPVMFGSVTDNAAAPDVEVLWNDGRLQAGIAESALRKVVAASSPTVLSDYSKKTVRLNDADPSFTGVVLGVFGIETNTSGGLGPFTDAVYVKMPSGAFAIWAINGISIL